jgi:hypothetical protein
MDKGPARNSLLSRELHTFFPLHVIEHANEGVVAYLHELEQMCCPVGDG